jgi:hypothetical protein
MGDPVKVSWSFTELRRSVPLGTTVACELRIGAERHFGYGDRLLRHQACLVSLAEAWERRWFHAIGGSLDLASTNGFAAGPTDDEAIARSQDELLDRSLMLTAWRSMTGWTPWRPRSAASRILKSVLAARGWHVRLFTISEPDLGVSTLAAFAFHELYGLAFDSVPVRRGMPRDCHVTKALVALSRVIEQQMRTKPPLGYCFPEVGGPEDHRFFYADGANARSVWEFLPTLKPGVVTLEKAAPAESVILFPAGHLPAVAVTTNRAWPTLSWGRASVQGANPWPHPLA